MFDDAAASLVEKMRPFIEDGEEGRAVYVKECQESVERFRESLWGIKVCTSLFLLSPYFFGILLGRSVQPE